MKVAKVFAISIVALGLLGGASVKLITAGQLEDEPCDSAGTGGLDILYGYSDLPGPAEITALAADDDDPADSNGPIAFAYIKSDGSVVSGTPNVTCSYNALWTRYDITIEGESYYYNKYVTVVTPCGSWGVPVTDSSSGRLVVSIRDAADVRKKADFQFVTYKPKAIETDVIELTQATFDSVVLPANMPVMVFFYADWCTFCNSMKPIVEQIATEYKNKALVCRINVDNSPSINSRYGVTNIPTFILFKGGQAQDRMVGTRPKETLTAAIDALL